MAAHPCMTVQSNMVAGCEVRNKGAGEEIAKSYYEIQHYECFDLPR